MIIDRESHSINLEIEMNNQKSFVSFLYRTEKNSQIIIILIFIYSRSIDVFDTRYALYYTMRSVATMQFLWTLKKCWNQKTWKHTNIIGWNTFPMKVGDYIGQNIVRKINSPIISSQD